MAMTTRAVLNRKTLRRTLIGALAGLLLSAGCASAASYPYQAQLVDNVNMRRSAYSTSVVLERLKKGQTVTLLGESGDYYHISFNGRTGYAMKEYVTGNKAAPTPVPTKHAVLEEDTVPGYPYETTTNASVNMRKRANTSSTLLTRIPKGADLTVTGESGSFVSIIYDGREGYAMSDYVNVKRVANVVDGATVAIPGKDSFVLLTNGASGTEVRALQQALKELGYLTGDVDGFYGNATQKAVAALQKVNGYPETGSADINLQALIYEGKPLNSKGVKTEINTLPPIAGTTMKLNSTGDAVIALQQVLNGLGYYDGSVNGVYDKATMTAVKAFQKKHSLKADGLAGKATQAILFSDDAVSSEAEGTKAPATATPKPTPAPTPKAEVKKGTKNNDAKLVQQRLKDLGYLAGKADGIFGAESVEALKDFQKANNIKADGICGANTRKVLFGTKAKAKATATPRPTEAAKATMYPVTRDNVVVLRIGSNGSEVLFLQQRLTELGYYTARMDGVFRSDDMAAVQTFQEANGITADGIAGYDTQSKLFSNAAKGPQGVQTNLATLRKGDSGVAVKTLQQRLKELGYLTGNVDGRYGTQTAQAVILFQRANGLTRDGIAGKATLTKLYSDKAVSASGKTESTVGSLVTTTVRKGDANDAVRTLQQKLISMGYLNGKADGTFGVSTYSALLAFQANNGLTADGIAGKNTWNKINSGSAVTAGSSSGLMSTLPSASSVKYENWYSSIKAKARKYPYATVYDFTTGLSWQVHMFSLGAHADAEPLTANDTANLLKAFGGKNTWNPKAVWVVFGDGSVYLASTHSMPHSPQHRTTNNFDGHLCIHFPRTSSQVAAIGPYATSHQKCIDKGWATTQNLVK